jgi:hypothetical protein
MIASLTCSDFDRELECRRGGAPERAERTCKVGRQGGELLPGHCRSSAVISTVTLTG